MSGSNEESELRALWDSLAADWDIHIGDEGDSNRRLNSDPVLWRFAGEVSGLKVLDAGCGTGYLCRQMAQRGAVVVGVDHSPEMIRIARSKSDRITYHVDSVTRLKEIDDEQFDLVVANYVLMDVSDLEGAIDSFYRVLKPGGSAITIFSHPCFPGARMERTPDLSEVRYVWSFPYFERSRQVDPPWAHFTSDFVWFHRPLSDYWKAFTGAGFAVIDFEEPRLTSERAHLAKTEWSRQKKMVLPYSAAFKLQK